jgi:hypothetical protein
VAKALGGEESPFERAMKKVVAPGTGTGTGSAEGNSGNSILIKRGRRPEHLGDWAPAFIDALMAGATVVSACKRAGVDQALPYDRRKHDEAFRLAWREACEIGTEFLEQEAQRRAYHGTLKPVYQKGVRVGYVREYSDTLLMFLIKKRDPSYREAAPVGGLAGPITLNVQVVNVDDAGQPGAAAPTPQVLGVGMVMEAATNERQKLLSVQAERPEANRPAIDGGAAPAVP